MVYVLSGHRSVYRLRDGSYGGAGSALSGGVPRGWDGCIYGLRAGTSRAMGYGREKRGQPRSKM